MTTNPPVAGIAGNTQAQATQATTNRGNTMSSTTKLAINIGIGIAFAGIGVLLAWAKLGFAWNLIIAAVMLWGGNKLHELKFPAVQPWGTVLRLGGGITFAVTMLFSGFGQWTIATTNWAEAKVTEAAKPEAETEKSEAEATDGSKMPDVPAEGMLLVFEPGTKSLTFTVPANTCGFRNYIPTATVDEINRGSWMDYLVQGPYSGRKRTLLVKSDLTEPLEVMVDPFTKAEATAEGVVFKEEDCK